MPSAVTHKSEGMLNRIFDHWDAKEKLCDEERVWWLARSNSFRKEARHTYEFEADL